MQPPWLKEGNDLRQFAAWEMDDAAIFASVPEECLAVFMLYIGHWPYSQALFDLPPDKFAAILRVLSETVPKRDKDLGELLRLAQQANAAKL